MGVVTIAFDIRNQRGEPVMSLNLANLVEVRDPAAGTMATQEMPYDLEHDHTERHP